MQSQEEMAAEMESLGGAQCNDLKVKTHARNLPAAEAT